MGRVLSQRAKNRGTFVSPARAVPQASAPFHSVSSFKGEGNFFCSLDETCRNATCFVDCSNRSKNGVLHALSTKHSNKLNLFKQQPARRFILGSDSPASRKLHIKADLLKQSACNEISKPPAPRVSRRSKTGVLPGLWREANPKQGGEYYQEEKIEPRNNSTTNVSLSPCASPHKILNP